MLSSTTFREKLPSALTAIAVQAGLVALLLFSLNVVRQVVTEKETIITLPLLRPSPPRQPVSPEARASSRPAPDTPSTMTAPGQAPLWFYPDWRLSGQAPGAITLAPGVGADCRPEKAGLLDRSSRQACARLYGALTPPAPSLKLAPPRVANEDYWAGERAASRTLPKIPCVSMTSGVTGEGGMARQEYGVGVDLLCALGQILNGFPGIPLPPRDAPSPPPPRTSDAAFQAALAAYHARMASLYGRPVLALSGNGDAKAGGGNEKSNAAGGADAGGNGPAPGLPGPGR